MKINISFWSLLLFLLFLNTLQAQVPPVDYARISAIKEEGFKRSQVMQTLFYLTDVNGPRLTGSRNLKNSQQWALQQLKDWGITQVSTEAWGSFGQGWEIEKSYLAMTLPYYQPLIGIPKAWTGGTNGLIHAQAVLLKVDSVSDLEKYKGKLNGKIVVLPGWAEIKPGFTPEAKRYTEEDLKNLFLDKNIEENKEDHEQENREKFRTARQLRQKINAFLENEKPSLIVAGRGGTMGTFYTTNGASYAWDARPAIPEMEMSTEHLKRLVRLLEAGKEVSLEAEIKTTFDKTDSMQYNVLAEIPGTDKNLKDEVVMIGAHLDSWHAATGATDNAAGCTVMMEVMRILKTLDLHPARTIRLALWSGEEQGILGSRGYVKKHFTDAGNTGVRSEYDNLSVYFNLDNGGGRIRGIYLQENEALRPYFETWLKPFEDLGATTVTTKTTGSTDHIPFDQVGLPGLQFIQDPLDYSNKTHHTNMDTYDRIQKADLMQASVIIASLAYNAAMLREKLPRKARPVSKTKGLN